MSGCLVVPYHVHLVLPYGVYDISRCKPVELMGLKQYALNVTCAIAESYIRSGELQVVIVPGGKFDQVKNRYEAEVWTMILKAWFEGFGFPEDWLQIHPVSLGLNMEQKIAQAIKFWSSWKDFVMSGCDYRLQAPFNVYSDQLSAWRVRWVLDMLREDPRVGSAAFCPPAERLVNIVPIPRLSPGQFDLPNQQLQLEADYVADPFATFWRFYSQE